MVVSDALMERRNASEDAVALAYQPETGVPPDLYAPQLFFNRELSWLAFNRRVLAQAASPHTPLLERLRFLAISSANLDEFFEIRIAGIKQQLSLGIPKSGPDGLLPRDTLQRVRQHVCDLVEEQYKLLNETLLVALRQEGVALLKPEECSAAVQKWLRAYFLREVLPVLTPMGLDPAHPFPNIINKSLCFIVALDGHDAFGRAARHAVVQVPRVLPRVIPIPAMALPEGERTQHQSHQNFITLGSVLRANMDAVFPGMTVKGCYQFRVTRNSELWVDEDEVDDLLDALAGKLQQRNYGAAVRLEVSDGCPQELIDVLLDRFDLTSDDLYRVAGPVNLHRLSAMYGLVDRPDLKYPAEAPVHPPVVHRRADMFAVLKRQDILLHHPYESFAPVLQLLQQAARDPDVLAIKMTLYRTGVDSPVVDALLAAAQAGKEVTAVVELRARFDEQTNIDLATRLQHAGANVVYGIVGYKAHAKMLLVVRREGSHLNRYVHLGTGNYHTKTSRAYTDIGYMTANRQMGADVHHLFQQLTGLGKVAPLKRLKQAPFALHAHLKDCIVRETDMARAGKPARIIAKINSLCEPEMIRTLYVASCAGVQIDLIVRGICTLRPGVPGISDNIRVRSIVGRYLEHSRVYYFYNDGNPDVFCASADWMGRNLFRRVEVAFPIDDPILRQRLISECLDMYLADNVNAWELGTDGVYRRCVPEPGQISVDAQKNLGKRA